MTFVKNNIDLFRKWIGLNKFIFVVLLGIFALGFILRITTLENNLLFGMEQGRDALKAADIYSLRDIVLIGPKTYIDGISTEFGITTSQLFYISFFKEIRFLLYIRLQR